MQSSGVVEYFEDIVDAFPVHLVTSVKLSVSKSLGDEFVPVF